MNWPLAGRALERVRDRVMHPAYRWRARSQIAGRPVRAVTVVCAANLCRSPFAAKALARDLEPVGLSSIKVTSAGLMGAERSSPELAVATAREHGIDLSAHRSTQITADGIRAADLIIVMSADQASDVKWRGSRSDVPVLLLGDLDPKSIDERAIRDPFNEDAEVFRACYSRIERCIQELVRILGSGN